MNAMGEALSVLLSMALPIIIIVILVVVKAVRSSSSAGGTEKEMRPMNPGDLFHREGRGEARNTNRVPYTYSRQVNEIHRGDQEEEYHHRMDQLKNLYESGMMERDEYNDRRNLIEEDYRNGRQL